MRERTEGRGRYAPLRPSSFCELWSIKSRRRLSRPHREYRADRDDEHASGSYARKFSLRLSTRDNATGLLILLTSSN